MVVKSTLGVALHPPIHLKSCKIKARTLDSTPRKIFQLPLNFINRTIKFNLKSQIALINALLFDKKSQIAYNNFISFDCKLQITLLNLNKNDLKLAIAQSNFCNIGVKMAMENEKKLRMLMQVR